MDYDAEFISREIGVAAYILCLQLLAYFRLEGIAQGGVYHPGYDYPNSSTISDSEAKR